MSSRSGSRKDRASPGDSFVGYVKSSCGVPLLMSAMEVQIENSGDAQRLLQTLPSEMFEQVQQVLMNGAIRVAERARELVPVRTGHLLASIRAEVGDAEDSSEAFSPVTV